jgi:hypothetical protein
MLYDAVAFLLRPTAWWGRLRVEGLEHPEAVSQRQWDRARAGEDNAPTARAVSITLPAPARTVAFRAKQHSRSQLSCRGDEGDAGDALRDEADEK